MGDLIRLGDCPLAFGDNDLRLCAWCGTPLDSKRKKRWCSADHGRAWADNHMWTMARGVALKRDGSCIVCGISPYAGRVLTAAVERPWLVEPRTTDVRDWRATALEVNHIVPRRGAGYGNGCHHHQDNLETLCHDHHLVVTRAQRQTGWDRSARELDWSAQQGALL